jgi:hypothetical protein
LAGAQKKTYGYCQRDEEKRQAFVMQWFTIPAQKMVYLDESGMDSRAQYDYGWNAQRQRFHALKSFSALGTGEDDCTESATNI